MNYEEISESLKECEFQMKSATDSSRKLPPWRRALRCALFGKLLAEEKPYSANRRRPSMRELPKIVDGISLPPNATVTLIQVSGFRIHRLTRKVI